MPDILACDRMVWVVCASMVVWSAPVSSSVRRMVLGVLGVHAAAKIRCIHHVSMLPTFKSSSIERAAYEKL